MLFRVVIGEGRTPDEALLFARVNQIGYDKGIKKNTITMKTQVFEIPIEKIHYDSSKLIKSLFFAYSYYRYKNNLRTEFSHSEYSYYCILNKNFGEDLFETIMKIYSGCDKNKCLAVKCDENCYKLLY